MFLQAGVFWLQDVRALGVLGFRGLGVRVLGVLGFWVVLGFGVSGFRVTLGFGALEFRG